MSDPSGAVEVALVVRLRRVEDGDVDVFFEHQADPLAVEMAAFPARDRAQVEAHWARLRADDSLVVRTIVADGRVAVRPVHAHVVAHDVGSIRVLEKCGFRRDRAQEAMAPAPDVGIEELAFVLEAQVVTPCDLQATRGQPPASCSTVMRRTWDPSNS